ncbi:uncharacterized protein KY384_001899 [Bacidia gigantensis]|uniref:uncharacterized protein n=1 Tax=Bacidia gigantensis TaxID=2732470 RepID=UPI001D04870C|nr:uncharacterized protein KY384_001899 [Bacidia gigantensis]KAG8533116.1 hypothetical protein KY384_001899 [Bacidia gigantensis]
MLLIRLLCLAPLATQSLAFPKPQGASTPLNDSSCATRAPGTLPDNTCYSSISILNTVKPSAWGAYRDKVPSKQALDITKLPSPYNTDFTGYYNATCQKAFDSIIESACYSPDTVIFENNTWIWAFGGGGEQGCLISAYLPGSNAVNYPSTDDCRSKILIPLMQLLQAKPQASDNRVSVNVAKFPSLPEHFIPKSKTPTEVTVYGYNKDDGLSVNGSLTSWIIQPYVLHFTFTTSKRSILHKTPAEDEQT